MRTKKNSPTDADIERINGKLNIDDFESMDAYQKALEKFMNRRVSITQTKNMFSSGITKIKINQLELFVKAKGKDFEKDKKKSHKIILTDVKKYKKRGASRSDLIGFDTARKFAYLKGKRRMIATNKTRIVTYPKSYKRTVRGKIQTVTRKNLQEVRVYDKKGKRLSLKKPRVTK